MVYRGGMGTDPYRSALINTTDGITLLASSFSLRTALLGVGHSLKFILSLSLGGVICTQHIPIPSLLQRPHDPQLARHDTLRMTDEPSYHHVNTYNLQR